MGDFTLDTSGFVYTADTPNTSEAGLIIWSDLDPFTQGYIEALWQDLLRYMAEQEIDHLRLPALSDLAPETLARIIADCEAYQQRYPATRLRTDHRARGANYWRDRQKGLRPLTPYLGDDGRVYLRQS